VLARAFADRAALVDADTANRELLVFKAAAAWWQARGGSKQPRRRGSAGGPPGRTAPKRCRASRFSRTLLRPLRSARHPKLIVSGNHSILGHQMAAFTAALNSFMARRQT
jgi:hypothetical protein